MREYVRLHESISKSSKMKEISKGTFHFGGMHDPLTDEEVDAILKEHIFELYHPCCTAKMGGVVD